MYEYGKKVFKKIKDIATSKDGVFQTIKKKTKKKKKKKIPKNKVNIEVLDLEAQIKNTEDEFNLSKEGLIEYAKIHSSANNPMHKIEEFNSNTRFCPCCN